MAARFVTIFGHDGESMNCYSFLDELLNFQKVTDSDETVRCFWDSISQSIKKLIILRLFIYVF